VHAPRSVSQPVEEGILLKDRVRWSAVWAGMVVAFGTQLVLSALILAVALGSSANRGASPQPFSSAGIWTAIAALIALFLGGWTAARLAGVAGRLNGVWNGIVVWALALTLGTLAASLGVSGVLGYTGMGPGTPMGGATGGRLTEMMTSASNGAWWFFIGALVALIAAALGGLVGARPDVIVDGEARTTA
jgi:hypothetical protein